MTTSSRWRRPLEHLGVTVIWVAVNVLAYLIDPGPTVMAVGIALHLLGLVISLGPIVLLDWYGLVWIAGLRRLRSVTAVTQTAHPLIWGGLSLLLLSGIMLDPDYGDPLTWVKQVAVLVLLHNGLALRSLENMLSSQPRETTLASIATPVRRRMLGATLTSQTAWWAAFAIGVMVVLTRRALV